MAPSPTNVNRRRFLKVGGSVSLTGLVAGCSGQQNGGGGDGAPQSTPTPEPQDTAMASTPTATPMVNEEVESAEFAFLETGSAGIITNILLAEGIDQKHNLDLTFTKVGLGEAQNGFFRGQFDSSSVGPVPASRVNAQTGVSVSIIGPLLKHIMSFLVKPDSDYESIEDLQGQKISTFARQSSTFNLFVLMMNEMGLSWEDDFELVFGSPISQLQLFDRGDVEAVTTLEPLATRWIADGKARELRQVEDLYEELFGRTNLFAALGLQTDIVNNNLSTTIKMHRAYRETLNLIKEDTASIIEKHSDLYGLQNDEQIELAKERVPRIYLTEWNEEVISSGQQDIELARDQGFVPENAPTDFFWLPPQ